jgi:hypothetical protein
MFEINSGNLTLLARNRYDIIDFVRGLWQGDTSAWVLFAAIAGTITFFALYKKITGEDFVKSKEERREARKRRKHVLWEYKRDD